MYEHKVEDGKDYCPHYSDYDWSLRRHRSNPTIRNQNRVYTQISHILDYEPLRAIVCCYGGAVASAEMLG